jgi:ABC-type multidrug transport system fused ATPase/permease subunit
MENRNQKVVIIDYGMGNIGSIDNMVKYLGVKAIISSDVNVISNADKIIFVKDGEIVEAGTHHELISKNGFYQKMYEAEIMEESIQS